VNKTQDFSSQVQYFDREVFTDYSSTRHILLLLLLNFGAIASRATYMAGWSSLVPDDAAVDGLAEKGIPPRRRRNKEARVSGIFLQWSQQLSQRRK